jgi:hypothetical protein
MRTPIVLILVPAALLAAIAPGLASATAIFPDAVKTDLSLTYTPPCTICHETLGGGTGTVTQAFGKAMKQNGLVSGDTAALQAALSALETAGTDSDGDCTPDIQQLKDGRDPNTGAYIDGSGKPTPVVDGGCGTGGGGSTSINPAYGCGARLSAAPLPDTSLPAAATLATVLGLALSRRRRRA